MRSNVVWLLVAAALGIVLFLGVLCTGTGFYFWRHRAGHANAPFRLGPQPADDGVPAWLGGPGRKPDDAERTVCDLPEGFADVRTGGGGRFLIFYLKRAKKLVVFDIPQKKIVREIDVPAEDIRFAAGRDKLLVVLPGEKVVQRGDLHTFQREKTVPVPNGMTVAQARMGYDSQGPLALWGGDKVVLMDVERMEATDLVAGIGTVQGAFHFRVSPDGQVFVAWHNNLTPSAFFVMRLSEGKISSKLAYGGEVNERWMMPNADGSLLFAGGFTHLMSGDLRPYSADWLDDSQLLATADPRFFLAASGLKVSVCASADRRPLFWIVDEALQGMSDSDMNVRWFYVNREEPRIRYLPEAKVMAFLPIGDSQVVVRRCDMDGELDADGKEYLFALSQPTTHARAGSAYAYQMEVKSKSPGVTFKLEKGPDGMTVSNEGQVRWKIPPAQAGKTTPVIVSVKNAAGKEMFHSFDLAVD